MKTIYNKNISRKIVLSRQIYPLQSRFEDSYIYINVFEIYCINYYIISILI